MNAGDFAIDYSSGLMTCCQDHINDMADEPVHIGEIVECEHCGIVMVLTKKSDGSIMWVAS